MKTIEAIRRTCRINYGRPAYTLSLFVLTVFLVACTPDDKTTETPVDDPLNITNITLPAGTVEVEKGGSFFIGGFGFEDGDAIRMLSASLVEYSPKVVLQKSPTGVNVTLTEDQSSGNYLTTVVRGDEEQALGTVGIKIIVEEEVPDVAGMNVKGVVKDNNGIPLAGVVMSDGVEVVITNDKGQYYMNSAKEKGYVFISIPSGYMVLTAANIPQISKKFTEPADKTERHDFTLIPADNDDFVFVTGADFHLSSRNNGDYLRWFEEFIGEVNSLAGQVKAENKNIYLMAAGDLTWETYWYSSQYMIPEYVQEMRKLNNVPIFNSMGNHDNDPRVPDDWGSTYPWRTNIGPTYYSFNLGQSHFVAIDNIEYLNVGATPSKNGDRSYVCKVTPDQVSWLKKDLAMVQDKSAPVFVVMHSNMFNSGFSNGQQTSWVRLVDGQAFLDCFDGFTNVHFLTGHSHLNRNVEWNDYIYEHNSAAIAGELWRTYSTSTRNIARDGTPAGYGVYEVSGSDVRWYYKGTGCDRNKQFRTYDLNKTHLDPEVYLSATQTVTTSDGVTMPVRTYFAEQEYAKPYINARNDNMVHINLWNYDSKWTIKVVEEGKGELPVQRLRTYDPLHAVLYNIPRLNSGNRPAHDPAVTNSIFQVKASAPDTKLTITATDPFGRVYTEEMTRPKEFNAQIE